MCKAARTPVIYHYRPSPRLVFCGWTPFPTLSISDAERRAYHNRRVSDALHHHRIFDTMMMPRRSICNVRLGGTIPTPGWDNTSAWEVAASRDPTFEVPLTFLKFNVLFFL